MRARRQYNAQIMLSKLDKNNPRGSIDPFGEREAPSFIVGPQKHIKVRRNDKNLLNVALHGVENIEHRMGRVVERINHPVKPRTKKGKRG